MDPNGENNLLYTSKKKLPVERKKKLFLNVENEDLIVSHVPQKNLKREVTIQKIPMLA